jgi:hypothetical protein
MCPPNEGSERVWWNENVEDIFSPEDRAAMFIDEMFRPRGRSLPRIPGNAPETHALNIRLADYELSLPRREDNQ